MEKNDKTKTCRICGLIQPIKICGQDVSKTHGYVCEFYQVRVTPDEVNDPFSQVRVSCIKDGDNFCWARGDLAGQELVQYLVAETKDKFKMVDRRIGLAAAAASILGVIVAAVSTFF